MDKYDTLRFHIREQGLYHSEGDTRKDSIEFLSVVAGLYRHPKVCNHLACADN